MTRLTVTLAAAVLLGLFTRHIAGPADARPAASPEVSMAAMAPCSPGPGGGAADYYKIVRAQYVNLSGNVGNFDTRVFITNNRVQPITLKEVYVLGPGGTTAVLATYTGLVGLSVPPLGQVQLPINGATIAGITAETTLTGNGVKSVVVGWHGPADAVDVTAVIEHNDCCGNTYGRAQASVVGVPLSL